MSELIRKNDNRATIRWKLLTGASALALSAYASSGAVANADDTGRPQIWIELGGQLSHLEDGQETFAPEFPNSPSRPAIFSPSQKFEHPPIYSIDAYGSISIQPANSDWIFSAAVRYGRSAARRNVHQQTNPPNFTKYYYNSYGTALIPTPHRHENKVVSIAQNEKFADTTARTSLRHMILDFQAGKDVGLGLFGGKDTSAVFSVGVRFAHFASKSHAALGSDPDWHRFYKYFPSLVGTQFLSSKFALGTIFHSNQASLQATRTFHGVGPSVSWTESMPFAGNRDTGELSVDWGANAALLFGRQRAKVHHQTTGHYHGAKYSARPVTYHPTPIDRSRSRSVTVPNVGGSLGLTYRMENFKVSFGYKADVFFNAMDGGIDSRKSENRAFYGPFASVSVGLGD
ncbi:MAG TPA: Lpg1974 family pore-forming outer membrane protein [Rhizomicrobium sp.]|nr:Lpg1974 family pore-forming outer membrane protein [Rhizomicrobium sp.]